MKKKAIYIIIGLIILISAFFIYRSNSQEKIDYTTVTAISGNLIQTVSETGTIKPEKELELTFSSAGKLAYINVKVGDKVSSSQPLAELDKSDLSIKLKETEANLSMARAQLDKLLSGASTEDRALAEANYNEAKASYDSAVKDLQETDTRTQQAVDQAQIDNQNIINNTSDTLSTSRQAVKQAQTALDNIKKTYQKAVDNKNDALLTTMQNKLPIATAGLDAVNRYADDPDIDSNFSKKNSSYETLTNDSYNSAKSLVSKAQALVESADIVNNDNQKIIYSAVIKAMNESFKTLNYCFSALEASITSQTFSQNSLDTAKATINNNQTAVSAAITALQTSKQALDETILAYDTNVAAAEHSLTQAQAALDEATTRSSNSLTNAISSRNQLMSAAQSKVNISTMSLNAAQAQLNKTLAQARIEDVMLQRAQIKQAEASVDLIKNQINNNRILAPNDGVITKVNYQSGEQTTPSQAVISMIADNNYSIEIDVSETDIAKVKIGNTASIYLDAYGEDTKFDGLVSFIEPAETVIQGVTYYKVKISFTPNSMEIKPGMTATAKIITDNKTNTVIIPQRAVIDKDGQKIVKVLSGGTAVEKTVKLGMNGDNGLVEILEGINANDLVITSTKINGQK